MGESRIKTSHRQKILIVDDKSENLFALEKTLNEIKDIEIIKTENGEDALKATLEHRFALAILDVQMPEMDGYELAELLRGDEKTKDIPILFLSAVFSDEFHVFKGYEAGAVDFITKPFDKNIMLSKVKVYLELDQRRSSLEKIVSDRTEELSISNVQLKESREHLNRIVQNNLDAIIIVDNKGDIKMVNPAAESLFGKTKEQLIGSQFGFPVAVGATELEVLRDGQVAIAEMHVANIEWEGSPSFLASLRDITKRKQAQDREKQLNNVLRAIRNIHQLIAREKDIPTLLRKASELLVESRGFKGACVLLDNNEIPIAGAAGWNGHFKTFSEKLAEGWKPKCSEMIAKKSKKEHVIMISPEACRECPLWKGNKTRTIATEISHQDCYYGVLSVKLEMNVLFDDDEAGLLHEIGADIGLALHSIQQENMRREADESRRKSEELLRETGDMARVGGWEINLEDDTIFWSEITRKIHEVPDDYVPTLEEAINFFPEAKDKLIKAIELVREKGIPYDLELPFVTAKGRKLWTHTTCKPEFRYGKCVRLRGMFQDITKLKQAEMETRKSEARYRLLFESSRDAIMTLAPPSWRFTSGNSATITMYGAENEKDFISRAPWEYSPPKQPNGQDSKTKAKAMIDKAMQEGSNYFEWQHRRLNGEDFPATVLLTRFELEGKTILQGTVRDISEQKKAEEEVWEKAFMIDSASVIIGECNLDGKMTYANSAFLFKWGFDNLEEVLGRPFTDFWLMEDNYDEVMSNLLRKKGAGQWSGELKAKRKDGSLFDVHVSAATVCDKAGKPFALMSTSLDITELKQTEQTIKRFELAMESSTDAIGMSTPEGKHFYQNQAFTDLFGEIPENPIKVYVEKAVGQEVFKTVMAGKGWFGEVQMYGKKGKVLDIMLRAYATKNESGKVSALVGVHTDITERKRIEKKIELLARFPAENPNPVLRISEDGTIEYANNAGEPLFEAIEDSGREGRLNSKWHKRIAEILKSGSIMEEEIEANDRTFFVTFVPLSEHGYVNVYARDETDRFQLETKLHQGEKMQAIGQLAGGVAHDFNNQLTAIMGYAALLRDTVEDDEELVGFTNMIIGATKRSADLTQKLLAFARKGMDIKTDNDIHSLIRESVDILKRTIHKKVNIDLKLNALSSMVKCDATHLENAFINLAINANDAMPGSGTITISTENKTLLEAESGKENTVLDPGEYIIIRFKDTGTGMPEKVRKHIFEPFFSTKGKKGTGLGLAAVYGTMISHQGDISVFSEEGQGTEFTIKLPVVDEVSEDSIGEETVFTLVGAKERYSGPARILLVDDEDMVRSLSELVISKLGHEVISCTNGREAIDIYQEKWQDIDLILLDCIMPEMDGRETYSKIKTINPGAKVIFMTGYSDDEDVRELVDETTVSLINKPFDFGIVAEKLKAFLG